MTNSTILVVGFLIVISLQLVIIAETRSAWAWVRLTFVPWFASISRAVNPDRK